MKLEIEERLPTRRRLRGKQEKPKWKKVREMISSSNLNYGKAAKTTKSVTNSNTKTVTEKKIVTVATPENKLGELMAATDKLFLSGDLLLSQSRGTGTPVIPTEILKKPELQLDSIATADDLVSDILGFRDPPF